MESFNTLEKVKELFNSVGCEGNENCYFVALKDYKKAVTFINNNLLYFYLPTYLSFSLVFVISS